MTYEDLRPLLAWRASTQPPKEGWTPETLAEALSIEGMGVQGWNPSTTDDALTAFRHRRQDGRIAVCRRFLEEQASKRPPASIRKTDRVTMTMTRQRATELGLLTCACGHPENSHFDSVAKPCAHCGCKAYRERGRSGIEIL